MKVMNVMLQIVGFGLMVTALLMFWIVRDYSLSTFYAALACYSQLIIDKSKER